ncbi:hypothetical protein ACOSQ3_031515 [Xanthoceras sorbifolium]
MLRVMRHKSVDIESRVVDLVKRLTLQKKIGFLVKAAGSVHVSPMLFLELLVFLTLFSLLLPSMPLSFKPLERGPRWGSGLKTPGENPLLTSKYAAGYVKGLEQSDDSDPNRLKVGACCLLQTLYSL